VFFLLLPTYLLRFEIFGIPTTLLEGIFLSLFAIFLFKHANLKQIQIFYKNNKSIFTATALFLLAATISAFLSKNTTSALGEWKAFFLEPILLFWMIINTFSWKNKKELQNYIILPLLLSGLSVSLLGIYQKFTGFLVPWDFWENRNTYRVTGWYGFPNAVGILLATLFPFSFYTIKENFKQKNISFWTGILFCISAPLTIFFAKGAGPILATLGFFWLLFLYIKKTRIITMCLTAAGLFLFLLIPMENPIKQEVLMQDRSGQIRVEMWGETVEFLKKNPIFGANLASYTDEIRPYRINREIEIFHHPHNIFLTMWVNIGIIGLTAFGLILFLFFKESKKKINKQFLFFTIFSSIFVWLIMGLVDSPYIKNDWAFLFWVLIALMFIPEKACQKNKKKVS